MLSLIAAVNKRGVIGRDGHLPWRDHDDMYRFKELTKGKVCLVGRTTYENLPPSFFEDRAVTCISHDKRVGMPFDTAIEMWPDAFVIGGASLYEQAVKTGKVKYYYLSIIDDDSEGDTFLPPVFYGITAADVAAKVLTSFKK